jgi:hypothetical protein
MLWIRVAHVTFQEAADPWLGRRDKSYFIQLCLCSYLISACRTAPMEIFTIF